MKDYIKRLIECGYNEEDATKICIDFIKNLHIFDLQFFVESVEKRSYVG